ncbi:MAG: hypothetical protein V5A68_00515 [Candidatus Thermoplasmatota archaeon]
MKSIGLYTKDFSLYHDLLKALKRRKISYISLNSLKDIPNQVGVLITSNKEIHDVKTPKVIAADAYDTIDHAIDLALHLLIGKDLYSKLLIGIDPGEHPGIAVVGDEILLQKKHLKSPRKIKYVLKRFLKEYPSKQTIIRIGHGSPTIRNRIINSIISFDVPIEIVDESKTSSSLQTARHEKDKEAAAAIAMMKGGEVQSRLPLEPSRGEIKKIQEKSRTLTGGNFSISEKKALKVLNGEISLEEAIKKENKK